MTRSSVQVRTSARNLDGFIDQQRERGERISEELRDEPARLRKVASAIDAYEHRPWTCRLGLHRRVPSWLGGSYAATCTVCRRHELPLFYK